MGESNANANAAAGKTLSVLSLMVMLLNAAGLLFVGPVIGVLNYFLRRQFEQFDMPLPWLTRVFLATPWWAWCLIFLPLAIGVFVLEFRMASKAKTMSINAIVGTLMLVFLAAYVLAMMLPMVTVMTSRM